VSGDADAPGLDATGPTDVSAPRYRLRPSIEPFFAASGDVYLLRPGTHDEHVVRAPGDEDRALLARLARDAVPAPAGGQVAARIAPLVAAGVVVPEPSSPPLQPADAQRFDRQLPYLAELGDPRDVQRRLRAARVVILGCGGLGTWALSALASVGIGGFVLIDHDTIELSNLNRQILYGEADVGRPKVEVAADWLRRFDATIDVTTVAQRIEGAGDLPDLVTGAHALVLVADWPPYDLARWVNEASLERGVPFITAGQQPPLLKVGPTYIPGRGPCLACHETAVRRDFPLYDELAERRRSDPPPATTLGPASGIVGTLLALDVMHLIAGAETLATHEHAVLIDMRTLQTRTERVERDPACAACGGKQPR
jgi:bacteriocin biosynthesis cyclodehydratase domain-containing protein